MGEEIYTIQLFATKDSQEAEKVFSFFAEKELPVRIDKVGEWYKVRVGKFKDFVEAKNFYDTHGLSGYITQINYDSRRTIKEYGKEGNLGNLQEKELSVNNTQINKEVEVAFVEQQTLSENEINTYEKQEENEEVAENDTAHESTLDSNDTNTIGFSATKKNVSSNLISIHSKGNNMEFYFSWEFIVVFALVFVVFLTLKRKLNRNRNRKKIELSKPNQELSGEYRKKKHPQTEEKPLESEVVNKSKTQRGIKENSKTFVGKLLFANDLIIKGNLVSDKNIVIERIGSKASLKIEGCIKSPKMVELDSGVTVGSVSASVVHTIKGGDIPKIPKSSSAVGASIKAKGDLVLPDGLQISGGIDIKGNLKIGKQSKILGNVKAKSIKIGDGTFISGTVESQEETVIGDKVIIGSSPGSTKINASLVRMGLNSVILGSINSKVIVENSLSFKN